MKTQNVRIYEEASRLATKLAKVQSKKAKRLITKQEYLSNLIYQDEKSLVRG